LPVRPRLGAKLLREEHVVGDQDRARRKLAVQQLEDRNVQVLPQVDQHEIERARELAERGQRVADTKLDEVGERGALELRVRVLCLRRLQLERDHLAADGSRRLRQPGGGVAVGAADLQDPACLAYSTTWLAEAARAIG